MRPRLIMRRNHCDDRCGREEPMKNDAKTRHEPEETSMRPRYALGQAQVWRRSEDKEPYTRY